jgi:transcriptional regulator with XRE-family HTH domain
VANDVCDDAQKLLAYSLYMVRDIDRSDLAAKHIASAIQDAINRFGITITDLGLAWGKNRQNVQHWIKGSHSPKAADLPRLCELLGISANELLDVPGAVLQGGSVEAHREWLLGQSAQTRAIKRRRQAGATTLKDVRGNSGAHGTRRRVSR